MAACSGDDLLLRARDRPTCRTTGAGTGARCASSDTIVDATPAQLELGSRDRSGPVEARRDPNQDWSRR